MGMVIATRCNSKWYKNNLVSNVQKKFIKNRYAFLAFDADRYLKKEDRMDDLCHLSEKGQKKISNGVFGSLKLKGVIKEYIND
jgi:hypothetical protein